MSIRHFGLLNLGRDKSETRSTQGIDRDALIKLRDALGEKQAAAFLVEINEGDDDDELALAREVFDGWHLYGRTTHEPILLSPDQPRAKARVLWVPDSAVPHWSPRRSVLEVELADEPETLVAVHYAAGPHTAGDRPAWARVPLAKSWDNAHLLHMQRKRRAHRLGRNVTEMIDANHYSLRGLAGESTVVHHRTDYGRAYPADGYAARFRAGETVAISLDSHGIHTMHGTYRKEKP
jgi:hypothetical protein